MKLRSLLIALALAASATAQTNVRAWAADGQTWIVWEDELGLRLQVGNAVAYRVFRSQAPIADVSTATRVGALFPEDWLAGRLRLAAGPSGTFTVPDGNGGMYTLAPNEAVIAYTPHTSDAEYFAVVGPDASAPRSRVAVGPVTPDSGSVVPHAQHSGVDAGHPFTIYALWQDGHLDPASGVPGSPVLANPSFNGTAELFAVFEPQAGLPSAPMPAVAFLHGGGGSYWKFRPSNSVQTMIELDVETGLYITFDNYHTILDDTGPVPMTSDAISSPWFGYAASYDRFASPATVPAADAVVVDYTLRRIDHVLDWLTDTQGVDPLRFSVAGLSNGGRGAMNYARTRPERVAGALSFVTPESPDPAVPTNVPAYIGTQAQDLATNLPGAVGIFTLLDPRTTVLDEDLPFHRMFWGTADAVVSWASIPDLMRDLNDQRRGTHLYWDERGHTAGSGTWGGATFVGSPRLAVEHLTRERSDRSFPAFYDVDHDVSTVAIEPLPTDPVTDTSGTLGGWFDWNRATIVDTPTIWAASILVVGGSPFAADNAPNSTAETSVAVRRAQSFALDPDQAFEWRLTDLATGTILDLGFGYADAEGEFAVEDLTLSTAPTRLELRALSSTWELLPGGTVGIDGIPQLRAWSGLQAGDSLTVRLTNASPGASVSLVVGTSVLNAPLFGGLLVPLPNQLIMVSADLQGSAEWSTTLPPTIPPNAELVLQSASSDVTVAGLIVLSNGLIGRPL